MTGLIVGNSRTAEMVGDLAALTPEQRRQGGYAAQRVLWFARDGDVVVLPWLPPEEYLGYVTTLTGTRVGSLALVVPPPGRLGGDILTPDRLADEGFRDDLHAVLRGRAVASVLAVYKDPSVVDLAQAVGAEAALPGYRFSAQGGDALVNSKAAFRAVAAGAAVATAEGVVVTRSSEAQDAITALLEGGHSVIVKQEFQGGGFGNEILSSTNGVAPAGAPRVVVLPERQSVARYLARRWDWLTGGQAQRLVVERYFPDSRTIYAEFVVTASGADLLGVGEILMDPVAVGEIVPPPSLASDVEGRLIAGGRQLCESFRVLGYRGNLSADAILTPAGDVLFTETNGRITGSTHLHTVVRDRIIGADYRKKRIIVERAGWPVLSFSAAVARLAAAGLGYDPVHRTGVMLTSDRMPDDGTLTYCVVAEDLESAQDQEHRVAALFASD